VEVTNRTITAILKRKVGNNPGTWVDLVLEAMWAYRTTARTPMGHPPFTLAFGIDAVSPAELVWPTPRIIKFSPSANEEALLAEQDAREELREQALIREMKYKRAMARYHDAWVSLKQLRPGDLVLRNAKITGVNQTKGKLSPKWEGPYVVQSEVRPGTYTLAYEDGQVLPRTWHADNLTKFRQ